MQTADWALVISICSAAISLAGFIWNVWSKFIYPKPKVHVSFQMMTIFRAGYSVQPDVLVLSATNMGPAEVTLRTAIIAFPTTFQWQKFTRFALLNPLHDFPTVSDLSIGPFGGGLPKKLAVGEQFSAYFIPDHEGLAKGDYQRIGFDDTFGSLHWAPRRHILAALPSIREACRIAGKDWRSTEPLAPNP
jgi:hypothetical protein